jgi:hypothetical protein
MQLARHGGRIGLVLPSGVATDAGTAPLRRFLLERTAVDSITGIDNRSQIFPIHRSVRFALLTCTCGQPTTEIQCRFGITDVEQLETSGRATSGQTPLVLTRQFLLKVSGVDDMGIPELVTASDLRIVEKIYARVPWLASTDSWNVHFGRELNASDDRHLFVPSRSDARARRVLEGKHLEPFRVSLDKSTHELTLEAESSVRIPRRSRLAFRDVASATNRLTLIAAIVPAQAVTTHTLFCLKEPLAVESQHVLCALLNSFVANYVIRLRVNTHVTTSLVSRLPVPFIQPRMAAFARLGSLSRKLMTGQVPTEEMTEYAELQALIARLYGLDQTDVEHVLSTFPLISDEVKAKTLALFTDVHHSD